MLSTGYIYSEADEMESYKSRNRTKVVQKRIVQKSVTLMRDPFYILNLSEIKFRVPDLNTACKDRCDDNIDRENLYFMIRLPNSCLL